MPCCGGKPCGGPSAPKALAPTLDTNSRYPAIRSGDSLSGSWKASPSPAAPQFDQYPIESSAAPFTYSGEHLNACNFPIGGFGAGNVMLRGDGTLQGWTVVNQCRADDGGPGDAPLPMDDMPCNFFGIRTVSGVDRQTQSFVLASPQTYTETNVALHETRESHVSKHAVNRLQTLPGIKALTLRGTYPIAEVDYEIPGLPLSLSLEASSPLIPNDAKNSSLPCAVFTFTLKNNSSESVSADLLQSQMNFIGWDGQTDCTSAATFPFWGENVNTAFATSAISGMNLSSESVSEDAESFGTLSVSAVNQPGADVSVIASASSEEDLWDQFVSDKATAAGSTNPTSPTAKGTSAACGVIQNVLLQPNETKTVTFLLSWSFPNRGRNSSCGGAYGKILPERLGNMYNNWFGNSAAVASYVSANFDALTSATKIYTDTLFNSCMPPELLDTAAGRLATMRSATMFWSEAGLVLGTEGNGCCPLNCSHVYGYTTLLERLYPALAKDMRVSDFVRNFDPAIGGVYMRFGASGWAIDGALASVIKTYLVVRQDDPTLEFLKTVWPNVKVQMQILMSKFDDGTGVIRVKQQNTYDTAMSGANTFIGSYYVTALRACAAMATLMGDKTLSETYSTRATQSKANYEDICWKGEYGYYIADVDITDCKYSYGPGCFVDQLCGIGLSSACGLGHVFEPEHEAKARHAITTNNIVTCPPFHDLQKHLLDGDSGVTVCTYPNGKLGGGMQYDILVSSGFTSPVIAGCLLDRNMDDAMTIATDLRKRHDGRHRSPWNEAECGLLYSRAMAHWNVFDQCCGHVYDCTTGALAFDPRSNATDFNCFFALHGGWGEYRQTGLQGLPSGMLTLRCLHGCVQLNSLSVPTTASSASGVLDGHAVQLSLDSQSIKFAAAVILKQNSVLTITLGNPGDAVIAMDATCSLKGQCCPTQRTCGGSSFLRHRVNSAKPTNQEVTILAQPATTADKTLHIVLFIMMLVMVALLLFVLGAVFGDDVKTFLRSMSPPSTD